MTESVPGDRPDLRRANGDDGETVLQPTRLGRAASTSKDGFIPPGLRQAYSFEQQIGNGAEASIWLAHPIDRPTLDVAVKVYRQGVAFDAAIRERLQVEQLRGDERLTRYAPQIHDFGIEQLWDGFEFGWEVLEFFPKGNLGELIARRGAGWARQPDDSLRPVLVELVDALSFWENQIGLRQIDFSPSNILVREDQGGMEFVISDFGGLKGVGASQIVSSAIVVKFLYMAPEARANRQGPKSPYWSLGVTLLMVLTGASGIFGDIDTPTHLQELVLGGEPDVSGIGSKRWRHLVAGLLTKRPEDRWGEGEVRRWLGNEEVTVHRQYDRDRAYVFLGKEYFSPKILAADMASNWDSAMSDVVDVGLEELEDWLQVHKPSKGLNQAIQRCRMRVLPPDRLVALLIWELEPTLRPSFRGHIIGPSDLARFARGAIAVERTADTLEVLKTIEALFQSRALNSYTHCAGCSGYAEIDDRWHRNYAAGPELLSQSGVIPDVVAELLQPNPIDLAGLLSILSGDDELNEIREELGAVDSAEARSQGWYRRISTLAVASDLEPAALWLKLTAARVASRQYHRQVQAASEILNDPIHPVARYESARDAASKSLSLVPAAAAGAMSRLNPLPDGTDRIALVSGLIAELPTARERLQNLAASFTASTTKYKARVAEVNPHKLADTPRPIDTTGLQPSVPSPDPAAQSFRRWSIAAVGAVLGGVLTWAWGASSYDDRNGPGGIWFLQIGLLLAGGLILFVWFNGIRDGREGRHREQSEKRNYDIKMAEYRLSSTRYRQRLAQWEEQELTRSTRYREFEDETKLHRKLIDERAALAKRLNDAADGLFQVGALDSIREFQELLAQGA